METIAWRTQEPHAVLIVHVRTLSRRRMDHKLMMPECSGGESMSIRTRERERERETKTQPRLHSSFWNVLLEAIDQRFPCDHVHT